jgi:hypothetical protein
LSRHPILRENKHAKFEQNEDDFVKPELFQAIYDQIYKKQVRTSISLMHKKASSYDRRGNAVDEDYAADVRFPTKYECLHQEKVIFVDETGENTNQTKNGHHGGQTLITTCN